jgi:hypothetical protein
MRNRFSTLLTASMMAALSAVSLSSQAHNLRDWPAYSHNTSTSLRSKKATGNTVASAKRNAQKRRNRLRSKRTNSR